MKTSEILKKRREQLGMSQEQLAFEVGYKSRSSINKIELGTSDIPFSKIELFARALKLEPEVLMGWTDKQPKLDTRTRKQYDSFMNEATLYFNDEKISIEDKQKVFDSLQDVFWEIKMANKRKK